MTKRMSSRAMICSTLAIATAMLAGARPAAAQALIGTIDSSIGIGSVTTGPGTTTISVTSQQAVINWTANGNSAGGVTTFSNDGSLTTFSGTADFAVLNRVSPSVIGNSIYMGGDISSTVNGQVGGTVYFYSPNGIIIGSEARINVGSLGLTTLPIGDAAGVWMSGFGTAAPQVDFGAATNAASFIRTQGGTNGFIASNGGGNYIALVAPRIQHSGVIRTDGAAALVAASAATVTFRTSGLFDIVVNTGSDDANGVIVEGGTIGRNTAAVGGDHHAYLVSVPANNAMTMLVQGGASLGFDIAGSAGVEGNTVVLSAGRNVFGGATAGPPLPAASATIDHATITSNLIMDTTGSARISSTSGATSLSGDATLLGVAAIDVIADQHALTVGGSLTGLVDNVDNVGVGGNIMVAARNGQALAIGGDVSLSANGYGFSAFDNGLSSGSGTGGQIRIEAREGSSLTIGGALSAQAEGHGGATNFTNNIGGAGVGGTIRVYAGDGASRINVGGATSLSANGTGGGPNECTSCSITGGNGTGGSVIVSGAVVNGSAGANQLTFDGGLSMVAIGRGGGGDVVAGSGTGGAASLLSSNATVINVSGGLAMVVDGRGGSYLGNGAGIAGVGTGGQAQIGSYDSSGGTISITAGLAALNLSAQGVGGSALTGTGTAGMGIGGRLAIDAQGAAIAIVGDVTMNVRGSGGDTFTGTGGRGEAGSAFAHAYGQDLSISGALTQLAEGRGGFGSVGGAGIGGIAAIAADTGSTLSIAGLAAQHATGSGGSGDSQVATGTGGTGNGGDASISTQTGGLIALQSVVQDASGQGGGASTGGIGDGGHAVIYAGNGSINIAGGVSAIVDGLGGFSILADGANGLGGQYEIIADGGTLAIAGDVVATVRGDAGSTGGGTANGGSGTGGGIQFEARRGGTLTILSSVSGNANGLGGGASELGATAGDGFGGSVSFSALGAGSTLDARTDVLLSADGLGGPGSCGECVGGAAGGNGTGGQTYVSTNGGNGNRIFVGGNLRLTANGVGSSGFGGPAGDGQGGGARLYLADDGEIEIGGSLALLARGDGGYHSNGGQAGNGTGGDAEFGLSGGATSLLTIGSSPALGVDRTTTLDASGYGGSAGRVANGIGGIGTGGWARIYGTGGRAVFNGDVTVKAEGEGGNGENGAGGAGIGGRARLNADGATYRLLGGLTLDTDSSGGIGRDGGAASMRNIGNDTNVGIFANRGGSITIDGQSTLTAVATGGNGTFGGSGGTANAGAILVIAGNSVDSVGSITLGALNATADATGGLGDAGGPSLPGGNGGTATGGRVTIIANSNGTGASSVTAGLSSLSALASGANGGVGASGADGLSGGNGGNAVGGTILAFADGGAARLSLGGTTIDASATGGAGGTGGSGTAGTGGTGGTGGYARGGAIVVGVSPGATAPLAGAGAAIDNLIALSGSSAGNGGNGGTGSVAIGNGGNGGTAGVALIELLAIGGSLTINDVSAAAASDGGNGGAGTVAGQGGDAFTSNFFLIAESATGDPARRGSMTLGDVSATMIATGGSGATDGLAIAYGGAFFNALNADLQLASYSVDVVAGDAIDPNSIADPVRLVNSTVNIGGAFRFATDNLASVHNDMSSFTAGSVTIAARDLVSDSALGLPATMGTINADTFLIESGQNIILESHLASINSLTLEAAGLVNVGNLSAQGSPAGSDIRVVAGSTVTTGSITADRAVDVIAGGGVSLGNVVGNPIRILSNTASVIADDLTSTGSFVQIDAAVDIDIGDLSSQTIAIQAGGNISSGNLTATVFGIDVQAGGTLTTGALQAREDVTLAALGAISTGGISSLFGAIDIRGASNVSTGNLSAGGGVLFDVGGAISTGSIDAAFLEMFAVGDITIGNSSADEWIDIETDGALTIGNMVAGQAIDLAAGGALVAGNLSAGLVNNTVVTGADYNLSLLSATSIRVGTTAARDWIGMGTFGSLTAGNIGAGTDVLLAADGAMILGGIVTGANDRLLIAGSEMAFLGGTFDDNYDRGLVFAAVDAGNITAAGSSVEVSGPVAAGRVDAFAKGAVSLGALTVTSGALIDSGGLLSLTNNILGEVVLISNDIDVASGATAESAQLVSRNAEGIFIGDGLDGTTGYRLSNAEYGRLGFVDVAADTALGAGSMMTIGDLTVANSGNREPDFTVGSSITGDAGGVIRIVGDVVFNGALDPSQTNDGTEVDFTAGRFELDATTGSLSILNAAGGVAGTLAIEARNIWVAETEILAKLAVDPNYAGRDADLSTATASRPEGVIRAGEIYIDLFDPAGQTAGAVTTAAVAPYSVLVQNFGSRAVPSGFTATYAEIISPDGAAPGAIDLVVNGQLITPSGTLTGVAVRDALLIDDDPTRFTASSTINGCALVGACVLRQEPPIRDPQPSISTEIQLVSAPRADDVLFGNEEAIEDNEEDGGEDSASSPISPPAPLFNTKPLEQKGDTDEPVSGGGNPALIGNGPAKGAK